MSTSSKLAQQLQRAASTWPADPFRPNLQLKTFLGSLANHPGLTPEAVSAVETLASNGIRRKAGNVSEIT
jgi:hypothetical protein